MSTALAGTGPSARIKRRYGLPYDGFMSSVPAHLCPKEKIWGEVPPSVRSSNVIYDSTEGKFFRRAGSLNVGGTTGILEAGPASMRARQMLGIDSPSIVDLGDGYPTHAVLYTRESTTAANNNAALYLSSTIASINYTLGMEFSATNHYPGDGTAGKHNIKCPPYYRTTDGLWGRLNSAAKRQFALAGSRRMLEAGRNLYFPNLYSLPMRWNKRYNELTSTGSQNLSLEPTGCIPPLALLTITTGTANVGGVWHVGDKFFNAIVYEYADGSKSLPQIPRGINTELPAGFQLQTVGASCDFLTVGDLPIGPSGVVGRWYCRSNKLSSDTTTGGSTQPDPRTLKVVDYIPNNTQSTYIDPNGNDLSLADRPDVINFQRQWPNPARHIGQFDGRGIIGYLNPHPGAIVLAPDISLADDTSTVTNVYEFDVGVTANKLTLWKDAGSTQIDIAATKTVQQVVDLINATVVGGGGGKWHAQLVPGADGSAPASSLCGTSTAGTPAGPADIDVGDTSKRVRCFSPSLPGIAYFSTAYLTAAERKGPFKGRWRFSEGGAQLSGSNFLDMWPAANIRTGLDSWGFYQGSAPLLDGSLLFFTKAIILFRNIKSGRSGLDDDYHPDDLFTNLGCIAWDSIAYGDGWAGCLTNQGYILFDGTRGGKVCISGDVWNPTTGRGEWAYEIAQSEAACGVDNDGSHFHAKVMGGVLHITYRGDATAANGIPDRMLLYDFSGSSAGAGLQQALRPDGSPWGWSAPQMLSLSVLGEVRKSGGLQRYGTIESNLGTTNGRVDQFETGTTDNGTNIAANLWLPLDFAESMKLKAAEEASIVYKVNGTGAKFHLRLDDGTTTVQVTGGGFALPTTGAGRYKRQVIPLPISARCGCIANQIRITDDGAGGALEVWGVEMDETILSSYT